MKKQPIEEFIMNTIFDCISGPDVTDNPLFEYDVQYFHEVIGNRLDVKKNQLEFGNPDDHNTMFIVTIQKVPVPPEERRPFLVPKPSELDL